MAKRNLLAKLLLYGMLQAGALFGVPIRPDELEELTRQINGTAVVCTKTQDQDED